MSGCSRVDSSAWRRAFGEGNSEAEAAYVVAAGLGATKPAEAEELWTCVSLMSYESLCVLKNPPTRVLFATADSQQSIPHIRWSKM